MPFIRKEDREKMKLIPCHIFLSHDTITNISVGDRCYYFYQNMVKKFRKNRRWTTAHNIYKEMIEEINSPEIEYSIDTKRAYELAWQVFFQLYVMPYELEKQNQNGDI